VCAFLFAYVFFVSERAFFFADHCVWAIVFLCLLIRRTGRLSEMVSLMDLETWQGLACYVEEKSKKKEKNTS
jgi:hypothetical protein